MGRRSTVSTKSGKYMNPTDQARKEARKRELKKNKKQRMLVRTAVLKGKNPREIIVELEKIDDMEFNPMAPPPLNEKVLKDKRRKLIETWERVLQMYEKEDLEQFGELKIVWANYAERKNELQAHFEAVQNAQRVRIVDIPLPNTVLPSEEDYLPTNIPLPPGMNQPIHGILKKSSLLDSLRPKSCPGVPVGRPPPLSDYLDDEEEKEENDEKEGENEEGKKTTNEIEKERKRTIRFAEDDQEDSEDEEIENPEVPGEEEETLTLEPVEKPKVDDVQKRMLAMAGQDVDAYLKELEEVHKQTQAEKAAQFQTRMEGVKTDKSSQQQQQQPQSQQPPRRFGNLPPGPPPGLPPAFAPPGMMLRPGVPPPGVRLPPGPPPGRPTLRMPPGPPPGMPPSRMGASLQGVRMPPMPRPLLAGPIRNPGVVSAGPQLIPKDPSSISSGPISSSTSASVIESKPQIRNLLNDVTRFVPTKVKVQQKDNKLKAGPDGVKKAKMEPKPDVFAKHSQPVQVNPQSKDDAYTQFMKEMEQMMK